MVCRPVKISLEFVCHLLEPTIECSCGLKFGGHSWRAVGETYDEHLGRKDADDYERKSP